MTDPCEFVLGCAVVVVPASEDDDDDCAPPELNTNSNPSGSELL